MQCVSSSVMTPPPNDIGGDDKNYFHRRLQLIVGKCSGKDLSNILRDLNVKFGMNSTGYEDIMIRHELEKTDENG